MNDRTDPANPVQLPPLPKQKKDRLRLHLLLFGLAVFTTHLAGASFVGISFLEVLHNPRLLFAGSSYSFSLLLILTAHEMGHYLAARYHKLDVTLPFYIPLPLPDFFHFGTMGAFIKIRSRIPDRQVLMDVAIAGPLAGFVVTLLVLAYAYATLPDTTGIIAHIETIHPFDPAASASGLAMGSSLLFRFFNEVPGGGLVPMSEIYHFPLLFAGWIGLFITALNLIPVGQLDGGHIIYSLLGQRARYVNIAAYAGLLLLTGAIFVVREWNAFVWIPWLIILLFIGIFHPPTQDNALKLDPLRRFLGWLCIAIFVLCFIPLPFIV